MRMEENKKIKFKFYRQDGSPIEVEMEEGKVKETLADILSTIEASKSTVSEFHSPSYKPTVAEAIEKIVQEGFLDRPRRLNEIRQRLDAIGVRCDSTTLSPVLLNNFIRRKTLKRSGTPGKYEYLKENINGGNNPV